MQLQIWNDLHVLRVAGQPFAGRPATSGDICWLWLAIEMLNWFEKIEPAWPSSKKKWQTTPITSCFRLFFKWPPVDPYHGSTGGCQLCFPPLFVQQVQPCAGGKFFWCRFMCFWVNFMVWFCSHCIKWTRINPEQTGLIHRTRLLRSVWLLFFV